MTQYQTPTGIITGERALCAYLVKTHSEACHEDDLLRLNTLCVKFNIQEYTPPHMSPPSLDQLKQNKIEEIKEAFSEEMYSGKVDTTLGWEVDARRSGLHNDLQNIETLYNTMVNNTEAYIYIKGADNLLHSCSLEEVKIIAKQIANKGLWNYQHKHLLEMQIDQVDSIDDLNLINW